MADINVNTYKLNEYAQRLSFVKSRINSLDDRLDSLSWRTGLVDLKRYSLSDYNWRLTRCQTYLQQTADDFENTEQMLLNADPTCFNDATNYGYLSPTSKATNPLWDLIKEEISDIPEDAKSAGETLAWIEKQYGKLPNWVTLGVDILVPGSLKNAYTLTSGILEGDLTLKDGWKVAKKILSKKTKLAVICETIEYTFEIGTKRSEEMQKQIYEQLSEGDVLGAVFDGAEGFVDTIIGGVIDVLGDIGGAAVDAAIDKIDNIPVVKGINMLTEYGTGLLGWNDGDGYSIGGLISGATEEISEGLDVVTDVITDATDIVTDTVTDGVKSGINWVRSWFD